MKSGKPSSTSPQKFLVALGGEGTSLLLVMILDFMWIVPTATLLVTWALGGNPVSDLNSPFNMPAATYPVAIIMGVGAMLGRWVRRQFDFKDTEEAVSLQPYAWLLVVAGVTSILLVGAGAMASFAVPWSREFSVLRWVLRGHRSSWTAAPVLLLLLTLAFRLAANNALRMPSQDHVRGVVTRGLGGIAFVLWMLSQISLDIATARLLLLWFFGLSVTSLIWSRHLEAHRETLAEDYSEEESMQTRYWAGFTLLVAGVVLVASLVGWKAVPGIARVVFRVLSWIWFCLSTVIAWIAYGVAWALTPIFTFLMKMIGEPTEPLENIAENVGKRPEFMQEAAERGMSPLMQQILQWGLIAAALVVGGFLIWRLANRLQAAPGSSSAVFERRTWLGDDDSPSQEEGADDEAELPVLGKGAKAKVRRSYAQFLSLMKSKDWGRPPSDTPHEFARRLKREVPGVLESSIRWKQHVEELTSLYHLAEYSEERMDVETAARAARLYEEIEKMTEKIKEAKEE